MFSLLLCPNTIPVLATSCFQLQTRAGNQVNNKGSCGLGHRESGSARDSV